MIPGLFDLFIFFWSLSFFFFFSEVVISNLEVQDFQLGHVSIQKLCCLSKVYPECLTSLALESVWASMKAVCPLRFSVIRGFCQVRNKQE